MKIRWPWLAALLPTAAGLVAAALVASGQLENHSIYLAARLVFVAPLVGVLLTGLLFALLLLQRHTEQTIRRAISQHQGVAAEERRRFLHRLDHELKNPLTAFSETPALPVSKTVVFSEPRRTVG